MMSKRNKPSNSASTVLDIEQIELRGFAKSITEIEWLLMLLVTLYYLTNGSEVEDPFGLHMSLIAFSLFVLGCNYIDYEARYTKVKLLFDAVVMLAFVTWAVWNTGLLDSPLVNLYILVIISSAITLGKIVTFIEILLIAILYFVFTYSSRADFTLAEFSELVVYFSPFVLVAYITTMLVSDMHYGRRMFKALSEVDEMTSLFNKRSFNAMYSKAAEVAVKYSQPLTIMMIDADNLKMVNDTLGHKAGDALIKNIASTIHDCLRASDVICRYGGDEFVALLPHVSPEKAFDTAERIRKAVQNLSFDMDSNKVGTTVSIGVASYPGEVIDISTLLEKADAALYLSKNQGRNKVASYSNVMEEQGQEVFLST